MKPFSRFLMIAAAMVLAGCAGSPAADDAAMHTPWPSDRFLTAEASGATEAEAKRSAMGELAAIFESRVYARTLQQATSWIGAGMTEQFDREVEQTIHIQTDVELAGARIGRTWKDDTTGRFRALALLDRQQAASRWQRDLASVQMTVAGQIRALETVEGRLSRLAALNRITAALVRETVIQSRLSVLGRPATPIDPDLDLTDVIARREALSHTVSLFIQLAGNPARPFSRRLTAELTGDGYRITPNRDEAAGLVTGTIGVQALDLGNPDVHFIRAIADVRLVDMDTGIRMATFDVTLRKGHVDEGEAARRAVDGAARQTSRELVRALGTLGVAAE